MFISDRNCDDLAYAIQCYDDHREECESQSYSRGSIGGVRSDFENKGCPPLVVTPTTMEPVTIPLPPCFNMVPPASIENASNLSVAKTFPISSNLDCTYEGEDDDFHHCSMFGFSTLRPFPDQSYRSHLEACNVPQPRFLLEHPTVTVEVEGDVSGETCDHTRLSKVRLVHVNGGTWTMTFCHYMCTGNYDRSLINKITVAAG